MHIHFKRNTAREVGTKRIWMGHEIISINLGEPSNISCTNGWAMKQIYLIFSLENRFKIKKSYLQAQLLIVFRIIQGLKSPLLEQPNHAEGGMDIQLYDLQLVLHVDTCTFRTCLYDPGRYTGTSRYTRDHINRPLALLILELQIVCMTSNKTLVSKFVNQNT